jgi:hypothetical protein
MSSLRELNGNLPLPTKSHVEKQMNGVKISDRETAE